MLSRVANALYWMGRYLERAENTTRLLLVTEDLTTEIGAFHEKAATREWNDLFTILPGAQLVDGQWRRHDAASLDHLLGFFVEPFNPYGVHWALRKARENARAVREALTVEVFLCLNETYRHVEGYTARDLGDVPAVRAALSAGHSGLLAVVGAIEHTLSRDDGWFFLKLGESVERVFRTGAILRTKLPALLEPPPARDAALYYSRWRSLLRALSSLENYRRFHGAGLEPDTVMRFLFFDAHTPRALRASVGAVQSYLDLVQALGEVTPAGRAVARLHARLSSQESTALGDDGTRAVAILDSVLDEITTVHEALDAQYFAT
jgi:uncharacterized alpha-E superfamily protein